MLLITKYIIRKILVSNIAFSMILVTFTYFRCELPKQFRITSQARWRVLERLGIL